MNTEKLWEHLNLLGLDKEAKHVRFGDVPALLNKFRTQRSVSQTVQVPKKEREREREIEEEISIPDIPRNVYSISPGTFKKLQRRATTVECITTFLEKMPLMKWIT